VCVTPLLGRVKAHPFFGYINPRKDIDGSRCWSKSVIVQKLQCSAE
jgi:hypothetical protein